MKISKLLLLLFIAVTSFGQKSITVEDIWQDNTFSTKGVPGFNFLKDGKSYARLEDNNIIKYDITTGNESSKIFESKWLAENDITANIKNYILNEDETKLLVEFETESIYRHSTKAIYFVFDINKKKFKKIFDQGKISHATFSPDANQVAFVYENNLYYLNLKNDKLTQITNDGAKNSIINGAADWVYEEEFSFAQAFWWSPDNGKIAYLKFDESKVKEFTMTMYNNEVYPEYETFKYPKVGEDNAKVAAFIYDIESGKNIMTNIGDLTEMYIPRVKWTQSADKLCVYKMNRHQNNLQLYLVNANNGNGNLLMEETNKYYIDITDDLTFLKDKKHFIWSSEKGGYNQLYLYNMNGEEVTNLTKGKYDVGRYYGVNEKTKKVYYQSSEVSPMESNVYEVNLDGSGKRLLTKQSGSNNAMFSKDFSYYVNINSTINRPNSYIVYDLKGNKIRTIEDNNNVVLLQKEYNAAPVEFFNFTTPDSVRLNGWMLKPADFDQTKQYPVFMYLYGGPGSQQVVDAWKGNNYWWFQMLAQQGFIVACVDNRGTGGRGEEFKKMTYQQLGHYETIDQIHAAEYLGALPYTDESRIGIFGWSYGGYMSSLCLLKGSNVFKAAIAVAPVTNWKWYDSVYTERYMRTYAENEDGYEENSPVNFAENLKGNYLLIHGMGDDNVHYQNTVEMTNALIKANKQFDYYAYPNKNHGIYGGNTRLHLYTKMTNFLNDKLKNGDRENYKKIKP